MKPEIEVLIVGAGPTGLVLALWLSHLGVKVRIVDKAAEPGTTSRALAVHARILEFYDQLDLAREIVDRGLKMGAATLWVAGKENFGSLSNSRVGWTAGGGLEWLFAPNWSVKVEYLYYDLRTPTFALSPLTNTFTTGGVVYSSAPFAKTRFTGNIVRAGLNYHFNLWGPAPVVAKY